MASRSVKTWFVIHRWTSLVCTVFLLLLCVTGLPLVFSDEIDQWLQPVVPAVLPANTTAAGLDQVVASGRARFPGQDVTEIVLYDGDPRVDLGMAAARATTAAKADPDATHFIPFDIRTAQPMVPLEPGVLPRRSVMDIVLSLHTDLFAGLTGELLLAAMGLLFVMAVVSGVVLYGPYMKKLAFGTVRRQRSARLTWLDLHNLFGIVTVAWVVVVGATGIVNELATPMYALWKRTDVNPLLTPWHTQPVPSAASLCPVQIALNEARRAAPDTTFEIVTFPGNPDGSPWHYLLWGHGQGNLGSQLYTPVLVDAVTCRVAAVLDTPWYLHLLDVSRPLHFGNSGGLSLRIVWALLDLVTLFVLASGLYLWIARRWRPRLESRP